MIKPAFIGELSEVNATYQTPNGLVTSEWTRDGRGGLHLWVTIPGNTTAAVWVPTADSAPVSGPFGVRSEERRQNYTIYDVGPGSYEFNSSCRQCPSDERIPVHREFSLERFRYMVFRFGTRSR